MSTINPHRSRMEAVQSPIIPIVGQLVRENPETISLGQGIVSYPPPPQAIDAIKPFLANPRNHQYQAVQGISSLLEIICTKLERENQTKIRDNREIVVTAGSNMAFMNAILAITSPDDEIILNLPYYFNHEMAIRMADCHPVCVATDAMYQPRLEAITEAITDKTRAIVTISPNNPTGAVYPEATLRKINQLCRERQIYHIHDEAYEYFTDEGIPHFSPSAIEGSEEYTISLYSLSKAYGFASWRIGYMVIPSSLFVAVKKIQDTILICPPVISQYAALGALQAGIDYCSPYLQEIREIRAIVLKMLGNLTDICTLIPAQGAFYVFLKIKANIDDFTLVKRLIKDYRIAVLPGNTFGMTDGCYLRIAYGALQKETLTEGIQRLVTGLKEILR